MDETVDKKVLGINRRKAVRALAEVYEISYRKIAELWGVKQKTVRAYLARSSPQYPTKSQLEIVRTYAINNGARPEIAFFK